MLTVNFNFHDPSVELPKESKNYIVVTENLWIMRVSFSAKWQMFNVSDFDRSPDTAIEVFYWAEVPEELRLAVKGKELIFEDEDFEL